LEDFVKDWILYKAELKKRLDKLGKLILE
jgi:hypothetical protein